MRLMTELLMAELRDRGYVCKVLGDGCTGPGTYELIAVDVAAPFDDFHACVVGNIYVSDTWADGEHRYNYCLEDPAFNPEVFIRKILGKKYFRRTAPQNVSND